MIKTYQQRIERIITVNMYTYVCIRTCINCLINVKIHVSQNLNIPAYELFDKFKVSYTINTFIWTVQCIFIWAKLSSSSTLYLSTLLLFIIIIFDNFEHCLSTSQKKVITSYLDDDEKASVLEKGHLPVKEMNQKISL